jgi:hypothetical protein
MSFSEDVSKLVFCRYFSDFNFAAFGVITNGLKFDVNTFGLLVASLTRNQSGSCRIVAVQFSWTRLSCVHIGCNSPKPNDFASSIVSSDEFGFCNGSGHHALFVTRPHNWTAVQCHDDSGSRLSGVQTHTKVGVSEELK